MPLSFSYSIRTSSKAKYVRIEIHPSGNVVVVKPLHVHNSYVERLLYAKQSWVEESILTIQKKSFPTKIKIPTHTPAQIRILKKQALILVKDRIAHFSLCCPFPWKAITIKTQRTRWGSCSSLKNLNFNYKIIFLPTELQDYIIVHELCHLKELNHSPRFWELVSQTLPSYKELRTKLKAYSL